MHCWPDPVNVETLLLILSKNSGIVYSCSIQRVFGVVVSGYRSTISSHLLDLVDGLDDYDSEEITTRCVGDLLCDTDFVNSFVEAALPGVVHSILSMMNVRARQSVRFDRAVSERVGDTVRDVSERLAYRWDAWFENVDGRYKALKAMTGSDLLVAIQHRRKRFDTEGRVIAFLMTLQNNLNDTETVGDGYDDNDLEAIRRAAFNTKPTIGAIRARRASRAVI